MRWRVHALLIVGLAGCGPSSVQLAKLDEVCGGPSPHRLLKLDPGEQVVWPAMTSVIAGRRYYVVAPVVDRANVPGGPSGQLEPTTTRLISTGPCGEDPRTVAKDIQYFFEHERWPGKLLGRALGGSEWLLLDPDGVEAPKVVFAAPGFAARESNHGLVGWQDGDSDSGSLVLLPWPDAPEDGPVQPVVLVTGLGSPRNWGFEVTPADEVFAIDDANRLIRVDLPDGSPVVEQEGVVAFDLSRDGRVLIWQSATVTGKLKQEQTGIVRVRFRDTGGEVELGDGAYISADTFSVPFVRMLHADGSGQRLLDPNTRKTFDLPFTGWVEQLADGRYLDTGNGTGGPFYFVDLDTGDRTLLSKRHGSVGFGSPDAIVVYAGAWDSHDVPLWRIPMDGSGDELLAHRATFPYAGIVNGRVVTTAGLDDHLLGDLVVVDPRSLDEERVDDHVFLGFAFVVKDGRAVDPPEVVYSVTDGDRSGVWLAQLAPW